VRALITGIRGQDGTYLAKELRAHGREVFGFTRGAADGDRLVSVDYSDAEAFWEQLDAIQPDEIYHLASPSCIRDTFDYEQEIFAISVGTTLTFLRWIAERSPTTRFFFAGSTEVYGDPVATPQSEATTTQPANAYAVAKLAGQELGAAFRRSKGVFASTGILFNHESPLRTLDFVTRRITQGVAGIASGKQKKLSLGNLAARRDWSHAADFARAFRLILEATEPEEFVLASGEHHSVETFCEIAFASAGMDWRQYVREDPAFFRADYFYPRCGDAGKARTKLGWAPEINFKELVEEMVRSDLKLVGR